MICGNTDVVISFNNSAIKVRPTQVNLRKTHGQFDHVRCRLTQEAGQYVYDNHIPNEPVYILSDGKELGRFFIPDVDDSVEVTEKSAFVDLKDDIQILDHTIIDKTFGGYNDLRDVVSWLVNASVEDQDQGVITGFEFTNPEDIDVETFTNYTKDEILGRRFLSYSSFYTDPMADLVGIDRFDLDYQNVSVLEALNDLTQKVQMSLFSRDDGKVWIGDEDHSKNVFAAGFGEDTLNITGISLPQNVNKIKSIKVFGGSSANYDNPSYYYRKRYAELTNNGIPDDEGETIRVDFPEIKNASPLEDIAKRIYIEQTENENNGTITVDVLSSTENAGVYNFKDVTLGDAVYVEDSNFCRRRNIPSGLYNISGIHHKINNRVGWNTTVDITQIPLMDNIEVTSSSIVEREFLVAEALIDQANTLPTNMF